MSFHSSPEHSDPEDNPPEGKSQDERDYSTRMDEILGDDGSGSEKQESDEEMFTYSGVDAPPDDYNTQLHDILGPEDEEAEQREVDAELSRFDDSDEFEGHSILQEVSLSRVRGMQLILPVDVGASCGTRKYFEGVIACTPGSVEASRIFAPQCIPLAIVCAARTPFASVTRQFCNSTLG